MTLQEKEQLITEMKAMTETNRQLINDNMELCRKMDELINKIDNMCKGTK